MSVDNLIPSHMPIPIKYLAKFSEQNIYHIYNRTNNRERLFHSEENRRFFIDKFHHYLSHILDNYCWCLLPNHFHFLSKIKPHIQIINYLEALNPNQLTSIEKKFLASDIPLNNLVVDSFKRFFQCYTLSFNKFHDRSGNLFYRPFKRVEICEESHFKQAVTYIHTNPVKHKIISDFTQYKWSSWSSLTTDEPTQLLRSELWKLFGGRELFILAHEEAASLHFEKELSIEG